MDSFNFHKKCIFYRIIKFDCYVFFLLLSFYSSMIGEFVNWVDTCYHLSVKSLVHADTVPRPHFVETQKKKTALVFEKNLYYKDTDKLWRCSYRQRMNCRAACSIMDNKVISNRRRRNQDVCCYCGGKNKSYGTAR